MNEREQHVFRLWHDGKTSGEIAKAIGASRSATLGIVHRMRERGVDLPQRKYGPGREAFLSSQKAKRDKERAAAKTKPKPAPKPEPRPEEREEGMGEPEPPEWELDNYGTGLDRQMRMRAPGQLDLPYPGDRPRHQCQWPSWSLSEKIGTICGLPVDNGSYCTFHRRKSASA